jgi:UPF0755 protein
MRYNDNRITHRGSKSKMFVILLFVVVVSAIAGAFGATRWYEAQLKPASSVSRVEVVEIKAGASVQQIADSLAEKQLIRSSEAFMWYVRSNGLVESMKAGTYEIDAKLTTPEVIALITVGKVQESLVTILPGQRLDQIRDSLVKNGYSPEQVDAALEPTQYANHPALVAKPANASLEGYLYPNSYSVAPTTTVKSIIERSLDEMAKAITPQRVDSWQRSGLDIHQAISLASVVEQEASAKSGDRPMIANVFLNRLAIGMRLESDPTYRYAGAITGKPGNRQTVSPYNTYQNDGVPPGPISNVSTSSLEAVATPKKDDFLFFVAGDDGITRFSKTLAEHQALTAKYCIELCKSY